MKSLPQNIRNEIEGLAAMDARKLRRAYGDLLTDATACKSSSGSGTTPTSGSLG